MLPLKGTPNFYPHSKCNSIHIQSLFFHALRKEIYHFRFLGGWRWARCFLCCLLSLCILQLLFMLHGLVFLLLTTGEEFFEPAVVSSGVYDLLSGLILLAVVLSTLHLNQTKRPSHIVFDLHHLNRGVDWPARDIVLLFHTVAKLLAKFFQVKLVQRHPLSMLRGGTFGDS